VYLARHRDDCGHCGRFPAVLQLAGSLAQTTSTVELNVNGQVQRASTSAPPPWPSPGTITSTVSLVSGTNSIKLVSTTPNSFALGVDTLAVGRRVRRPPLLHRRTARGWFEDLIPDTYNDYRSARLDNPHPPAKPSSNLLTRRLLDTAGWRLLDEPRVQCGPRMVGRIPASRW